MKWFSTLWEMSEYQLQQYLKKHRQAVDRLFAKASANNWIEAKDYKLFKELLDGYQIMDFLYQKQEEVHKKKVDELQSRIQELEKRLHLNPENSHKPPSTGKFKKIKNQRENTGKKIGAQKGHEGVMPELDYDPDQIIRYEQQKCRSCGCSLAKVEDADVDRRQIIDIKDGGKHIIEHQRITKFCPNCGDMNRGDVPQDAAWMKAKKVFGTALKSIALYFSGYQLIPVARTQEILFDLYGVRLSQGSICNFMRDVSGQLIDWENSLKSQLTNSRLLHVDETGIRCEKRTDWVHVLSTEELTLLSHHQSRGAIAQEDIGVLPEYRGHLVHDGFKSYDQFTQCGHSYCNAHILRELKYIHEEDNQSWALKFSDFLKSTLHRTHESTLTALDLTQIKKHYDILLKEGFKEAGYPRECKGRPPDGFKNTWENGKRKKIPTFKRRKLSKGMNLLVRLRDNYQQIMSFALKKDIPFTNNQAERDFRMLKVKEKVSGCFRSKNMAKHFLRVRSFLCTLKKQQLDLLDNLYLLQVLEI